MSLGFRCRLALSLGLAVGCGSNGTSSKTATTAQSLSEALSSGVKFKDGLFKPGNLPKPNPGGEKLKLASDTEALGLSPGASSIMPLDCDNPDEDTHAVAATLMQFDGASGHVEVPAKKHEVPGDAGTDQKGSLHIENGFDVAKDICKLLCNQRYASKLTVAVTLDDGSVSEHLERALELDCTDDGDPKLCSGKAGADAGKAGHAGGAGKAGGGTAGGGASGTGGASGGSGAGGSGTGGSGTGGAGERDAGGSAGSGGSGGGGTGGSAGASGAGSGGGGASGGSGGVGGSGGSGGVGGGGAGGSGGSGGVGGSDAGTSVAAPQIASITPNSVTAGDAPTLMITGTGFVTGAVVYLDGMALTTTFTSDTALQAAVPASSTGSPGSLAVYVDNVAGDDRTASNTLYLTVNPVAGAPVIYDYSPDNGIAGDTILIIASNLAGQTLTIHDANGLALTPGTIGTISWPTVGTADTVQITLPSGIATGPITVQNSMGSFKGKIFSVGSNLTRAAGTTLSSSTQYNTSNWSTASGGDNSLATSFFSANYDCATNTSCTSVPWYKVTFASAQTVGRIAMRGNREYASGYDFLRGTFELLGAGDAVLWSGTYDLPEPDRDLDIVLTTPVDNVVSVKFTSVADESVEPGFSELEVFGP